MRSSNVAKSRHLSALLLAFIENDGHVYSCKVYRSIDRIAWADGLSAIHAHGLESCLGYIAGRGRGEDCKQAG